WFSTQRLFHHLPGRAFDPFQQRPTLRVVATDDVWSEASGQRAVQMFMQEDPAARQSAAPADRLDLQPPFSELHGVVAGHRALVLKRKDEIQIPPPAGQEGTARLRRGNAKTSIELGDVLLAQELVRRFLRGDPAQAQLLRQPSLPGAEVALRAPARLRRVGR